MNDHVGSYKLLDNQDVNLLYENRAERIKKRAVSVIKKSGEVMSDDLLEFTIEVYEGLEMMRADKETSENEIIGAIKSFASKEYSEAWGFLEHISARVERRENARSGYRSFLTPDDIKWVQEAHKEREDTQEIEDFFDGFNRVFIKMPQQKSEVQRQVENLLAQCPEQYVVTDWADGKATDKNGKQVFKIGKLLSKMDSDLYEAFQHDPSRTVEKLLIVISKDYNDIAKASTNRQWVSCAAPYTFKGERMYAFGHLAGHIQSGGMIAYLISENDPHIGNPLARVMIKPFHRRRSLAETIEHGKAKISDLIFTNKQLSKNFNFEAERLEKLLVVDKPYGLANQQFIDTVCAVIDDNINKNAAEGSYGLDKRAYDDKTDRAKFKVGRKLKTGQSIWSALSH